MYNHENFIKIIQLVLVHLDQNLFRVFDHPPIQSNALLHQRHFKENQTRYYHGDKQQLQNKWYLFMYLNSNTYMVLKNTSSQITLLRWGCYCVQGHQLSITRPQILRNRFCKKYWSKLHQVLITAPKHYRRKGISGEQG